METADSQTLSTCLSCCLWEHVQHRWAGEALLRNLCWGPFFQFDVLYPHWLLLKLLPQLHPSQLPVTLFQTQCSPDCSPCSPTLLNLSNPQLPFYLSCQIAELSPHSQRARPSLSQGGR